MAASGSILGNSVLRREDPKLLTGANQYYDDMKVPGMLHLAFQVSPVAHGTIQSIDTSDAEGMPGVVAVYTADNLGLDPFLAFPMVPPHFARPPLAKGKVRFVGDCVAAVVAETPEQAADAAAAVVVDYDVLDAVTSATAALEDGAPVLFDENGGNLAFETAIGMDEDPLEGATTVVTEKIVSQRLAGVPMEPNGIVALPGDTEGGITVYVPHQAPHSVQEPLAGALGLEASAVRVIAPWVGGGFGPKAAVYPEYLVVAKAAMLLDRPIKWTETRSHNMLSMVHGRDFVMEATLGLDDDGHIVGLKCESVSDAGAYPIIGTILVMLTQMMSQAVYKIPKIQFHGRVAATNTTPTGAYRGAGRPEATQYVERIMDVAARAAGIDSAEFRRRNYLQPEDFPLTTLTGANYDSGEYEKALDAALAASGYEELRAEQARRREAGDAKQLGIGVSSYVEVTAPIGLHSEYGAVEIQDDGTVIARVGTSAHGQGHETAFSMIIADTLGVPMDSIKLVQSDTHEVKQGAGTMGSRSLQTAGNALLEASNTVLAKARELAAHLLEASAEDVVVGEGGLQVSGVPASSLSWAELAQAANDDSRRPEGMEGGLAHELVFDGQDSTFPFGTHVAVVEVDTETGNVQLIRHVAVDDCGTILNPMLVNGQQHGGIAQGVAQALFEWVRYDESGNPVTGTLMDYLMPTAAEMPSFEASNTQTASPRNPLGAKGIGESGTIGSTPAVHNAVCDAVSHLGISHIDMPCSPERVWEALKSAAM
jgi:carbon-monoxide dehydrogenase large subunit